MGKSKKNKKDNQDSPQTRKTLNPDHMYLVLVYWVVSIGAYAWCWNKILHIDYLPLAVVFSIVLAVAGLIGSGGAQDFQKFNGRKCVISMAFALVVVTALMPVAKDRIAGNLKNDTKTTEEKFAPLAEKSGPSASEMMASNLSTAFQNALANGQQPPAVRPPSSTDIDRALESSKRFFWGVITGENAVVESESTMELADKVAELELPKQWMSVRENIKFTDLSCTGQEYSDGKLFFTMTAGEGIVALVTLTEQLTWEVSDFQIK